MPKHSQCDRLLSVLIDGGWHTTKELMEETGIWYPARRIFDLKERGHIIESELCSHDGFKQHRYRLVSRACRDLVRDAIIHGDEQADADGRLDAMSY
jgi:hypothetical protein